MAFTFRKWKAPLYETGKVVFSTEHKAQRALSSIRCIPWHSFTSIQLPAGTENRVFVTI